MIIKSDGMTRESMIKVLRYKAEHIKAKIKPEFFAEVADMLEQEPCEDTISRADAIRVASGYCHPANIAKELAKLPPVTPDLTECEDCVSRKELMDNYNGVETPVGYRKVVDLEVIKNMPPVTPQPKVGHWILTDDDLVYCSECEDSYYPRPIDASWYYCPHCGARMIEPQESEGKE